MIPIPNLPTDNLYKFCFVGGIILVLSAAYLSFTADKLRIGVIEQSKIMEYTLFLQKGDNERLRKVDSLLRDTTNNREGLVNSDFFRDEVKPLMNSSRLDSITNIAAKMGSASSHAKIFDIFAVITAIVGFGLIGVSGYCWYVLNQKVQDKLLAVQLRSAEIDLELSEMKLKEQKAKEIDLPQDNASS